MGRFIVVLLIVIAGWSMSVPAQEIMSRELAIQSFEHTDYGLRYLRSKQAKDGSWADSVAVTALALRAFLESYRAYNEGDGPFITRPLKFLLAHANDDGSISNAGQNPVSSTALAMVALKATNNPAYDEVIKKAQGFLKRQQLDEGEGYNRDHPDYGGVAAGDGRPDLIDLYLVIEALRSTGLEQNDPFWQKVLLYASRTQNLNKTNDQKWAANDGGFAGSASPASAGEAASGCGATQAGLLSLQYAGIRKNDPRIEAAWMWLRTNCMLDSTHGMKNPDGLFDYYDVFAKNMRAIGEASYTDGGGNPHNWRNELATSLLSRYKADGSWADAVKEGVPARASELTTAWAVNTLNHVIHSLR